MEASKIRTRHVAVRVWALRIALILVIVILAMQTSGIAALAFAVAWGPNGLFLWLFMQGRLKLPRALEPIHPIEPVLYRWLGVGWVKRIVATPLWPQINGFDVPPKATNRRDLLNRTDLSAQGAEICHLATFVGASLIALLPLAAGNISVAVWIVVLNVVLNGYPVMLQRCHRWRIQRIRADRPRI